jgi:two-component system, NarL family, response regulator DesR
MEPVGANIAACRAIFATPNPLLIAGVREVLTAAGINADPRIVAPEGLAPTVANAEACLVILDGQALPRPETLAQLCRSTPRSRFVLWAVQPTADLLHLALECGVHGLLSTRLPLEEAANALLRICRGERILRFDPDSGPATLPKPLHLSPRERRVLMELASGASNAAIAEALHTTASTVKGCLARLFRKTGTRNRRELAQLSRSLLRTAEQPKETEDGSFDTLWMLENL